MKNKTSKLSITEILVIVVTILILGLVTIIALRPQEIRADGRNSRRVNDLTVINNAISEWFEAEGIDTTTPYEDLLNVSSLEKSEVIDINDGITDTEAIAASKLVLLVETGYLQSIPTDPTGEEYRVGINNPENPSKIFVCTNDIEITPTYPNENYPNGEYCISN